MRKSGNALYLIAGFLLYAAILIYFSSAGELGKSSAYLLVLVLIPLTIFCIAVVPALRELRRTQRAAPRAYRFAFGGLTFPLVVTSTLGSLLTTGTFLNATLVTVTFGGASAVVGWALAAITAPLVLYFLLTSSSAQKFYSGVLQHENRPVTIVGFMSSEYGPRAHRIISWFYVVGLSMILLFEIAAAVYWSEQIFWSRFQEHWLLVMFWCIVCTSYVFFGGYRQVLKTDYIQFWILIYTFIIFMGSIIFVFYDDILLGFSTFTDIDWFLSQERFDARREKYSDLISSNPSLFHINGFVVLGVWFMGGFWLIATPDVWNRFSHYFLIQRPQALARSGSSGERQVRRELASALMIISVMYIVIYLPLAGLGLFAFAQNWEQDIVGDVFFAPFEIVTRTIVSLSPSSAEGVGFQVSLGGLDFLMDLSVLFSIMLLSGVLILIMTTLDTVIITVVQIFSDRAPQADGSTSRPRLAESMQDIILVFTLIILIVAFVWEAQIPKEDGYQWLVFLSAFAGASIAISMSMALFFRTWAPGFFGAEKNDFPIVFAISFVIGKILWAGCSAGEIVLGPLNFEKRVGTAIPSGFIVDILSYVVVIFLYWCFFRRRSAQPEKVDA
ncbi:MAG: hypothetical protein ACFB0F_00540 [Neomegalonema sp.]